MGDLARRTVSWPDCRNARDLGGQARADGGRTAFGAFVRADALTRLSADGRESLLAYGVRTVIDLRNASELLEPPHPFGRAARTGDPTYCHRPLMDMADQAAGAALAVAPDLGTNYLVVLDHFGHQFRAVFETMAEAPAGGIVFHCHAGKDRTGLVAALLLDLVGVDRADIVADYTATRANLAAVYDPLLALMPDGPEKTTRARLMDSPAEAMETVIGTLQQRHGGAAGYLRSVGVRETSLEALARRLAG